MKLRYLLIALAFFSFGGLSQRYQDRKQFKRPRPLLNFLTPAEFNEIVKVQNRIREQSPDEDEAEEAGMVAHLAEEGFRIGYMMGMERGRIDCDDEMEVVYD